MSSVSLECEQDVPAVAKLVFQIQGTLTLANCAPAKVPNKVGIVLKEKNKKLVFFFFTSNFCTVEILYTTVG